MIFTSIKQALGKPWRWVNSFPAFHVDIAIAVGVALIDLALLALSDDVLRSRDPDWLTYLLTAAIALPLAYRRRRPMDTAVVVLLLANAYQIAEKPPETHVAQMLPIMLALYAVGAYEEKRIGVPGALLAAEAFVVVAAINAESRWSELVGNSTLIVASLAVGMVIRGRRERAFLAAQRAVDEANKRVAEERVRIARELHDVIAHSIATINVQAGMAVHVFDQYPDQARQALEEIRSVSKETMGELRATLHVLRSDQVAESTSPAPHIEQIGDLIQRAEMDGLGVSVSISGTTRALGPATDLTIYRVVQEALTNVANHAGPGSRVSVHINYLPDAIEIVVSDSGPADGYNPVESVGSGLGLVGMRERVTSLGGEIMTGPRPDGGFEVNARLPIGSER